MGMVKLHESTQSHHHLWSENDDSLLLSTVRNLKSNSMCSDTQSISWKAVQCLMQTHGMYLSSEALRKRFKRIDKTHHWLHAPTCSDTYPNVFDFEVRLPPDGICQENQKRQILFLQESDVAATFKAFVGCVGIEMNRLYQQLEVHSTMLNGALQVSSNDCNEHKYRLLLCTAGAVETIFEQMFVTFVKDNPDVDHKSNRLLYQSWFVGAYVFESTRCLNRNEFVNALKNQIVWSKATDTLVVRSVLLDAKQLLKDKHTTGKQKLVLIQTALATRLQSFEYGTLTTHQTDMLQRLQKLIAAFASHSQNFGQKRIYALINELVHVCSM